MNTVKLIVIIPAFNEAGKIKATIKDLKEHGFNDIVVVDDGSLDDTSNQAKSENVAVLQHVTNRGLGAALGTGFDYARSLDPDFVVTFDADGQHKASDLKRLIAPLESGRADVVIGSRLQDFKNMPKERQIANFLGNLTTYLICGVWTTDSQSGLRAFNRKALNLIQLKTDRMEVSSEFFREIGTKKLILEEIPIAAIYTDYSQKGSKQGNVALASVKIGTKLLLRLFR